MRLTPRKDAARDHDGDRCCRADTYDYALASDVDRAPLRFVVSPLPTALALTRDTLQAGRLGTPVAWRKAVASRLRTRDVAALAPLTDRRTTGWPALLDDVGRSHETMDEALQRLAATSGDALLDALECDRDVTPSTVWDPVRRNPDRWLRGYLDALRRGSRALEPLWRRSTSLIEHEAERVSAAAERGVATAQLVNELLPRTSLVDEALFVAPADEPRRLHVDEDGLTVTPIIAASRAGTLSSPGEFWLRSAYPLPEAWRAFDDAAPPAASLQALLGAPRAALLQRLDQPLPAGDLAEIVGLAPSTVTFHLRALEAAGLVSRQRHGRHTIVQRTSRGTKLLALYT